MPTSSNYIASAPNLYDEKTRLNIIRKSCCRRYSVKLLCTILLFSIGKLLRKRCNSAEFNGRNLSKLRAIQIAQYKSAKKQSNTAQRGDCWTCRTFDIHCISFCLRSKRPVCFAIVVVRADIINIIFRLQSLPTMAALLPSGWNWPAALRAAVAIKAARIIAISFAAGQSRNNGAADQRCADVTF